MIEQKLTSEAIWNQVIYSKYKSKLKIDKNKILEEIKKNKQFNNSFLLSEIFFTPNSNYEIETISKKIKASIDENGFENTASIYSVSASAKTGGNIGWVNETTINKNLLSKISNLEIGEFTKPITVPGGFLILRVNDRKKIEKNINIEKEVNLIANALQNEQLNQYSNIYFNKISQNISINE